MQEITNASLSVLWLTFGFKKPQSCHRAMETAEVRGLIQKFENHHTFDPFLLQTAFLYSLPLCPIKTSKIPFPISFLLPLSCVSKNRYPQDPTIRKMQRHFRSSYQPIISRAPLPTRFLEEHVTIDARVQSENAKRCTESRSLRAYSWHSTLFRDIINLPALQKHMFHS